ncbi:NAD(P)H-binding protein [Spirosoma sp. BT702]|uniref:NAD(P)H-binding protein n=1 Tax=Spirosoma profusum TaxID=2771354 RepID=A0A926XVG0_9BACT|nr:NAD(P)H-binding protein [Spirosoma profusum]MBD2700471.1 NAD(P)H-binding protein [Spirosoma profusum]
MRVAIIGATGMLGHPVTLELIRAGHTIRIIARDVAKAKALFPQTEVVPGDIENATSLTDALQGMDAVYLNLSVKQTEKQSDFHTEREGLTNLIQAAHQARIRRIAYLSSIVMRYQGTKGFHWWAFDVKQSAVRLLKESGIPYSIFYPSCFMETISGPQRAGKSILLIGRSAIKQWYVAAQDYGQQVAKALSIAKEGEPQEYVIQGPEPVTQHEAAERFVAAYPNGKLRVLTAPALLMKFAGWFTAMANYGWHITEAINKYPETFEAAQTWTDLGKPEINIERFAKLSQ